MKVNVESWRITMKAINENITHAEETGLPLVSIELDPKEWEDFVHARTTLVSGKKLDAKQFEDGRAYYRGIKIYNRWIRSRKERSNGV